MFKFSIASETYHHKFSNLNKHKFSILPFGRSEVHSGAPWAKPRCAASRSAFFSEGARKKICFLTVSSVQQVCILYWSFQKKNHFLNFFQHAPGLDSFLEVLGGKKNTKVFSYLFQCATGLHAFLEIPGGNLFWGCWGFFTLFQTVPHSSSGATASTYSPQHIAVTLTLPLPSATFKNTAIALGPPGLPRLPYLP